MRNLKKNISTLTGKKKSIFLFIIGCLTTLAHAPIWLIPIPFLTFPCLIWLLNSCKNSKQAFLTGWWFGLGYFTAGLYWISISLFVDPLKFAWLLPFTLLGIPAIIAIYTAITTLLTYLSPYKKTWQQIITFATIWTITEITRGYLFTGFPWNNIGYIWTSSDSMLQITSIIGIYGLSFITILACTLPSLYSTKNKAALIIPALLITSIYSFGKINLANNPTTFHPDLKIRIVQPNVSQHEKWDENKQFENIDTLHQLSSKSGWEDLTHILWPEAALPFFLNEYLIESLYLPILVPKNGLLITGAIRQDPYTGKIHNSIHTINKDGKITNIYDKHHLVPFGEYVPFRNILPIEKITPGLQDFSEGAGIKTLTPPGFLSFSPLICYEAIFPRHIINQNKRPQLLINVTNDAWYGNSTGPYQHFHIARTRTVEEGIPLIRAANTGISGTIDAFGRIINSTSLNQATTIDTAIPQATSATLYSKYGNLIILSILLILSIVTRITPKKTSK